MKTSLKVRPAELTDAGNIAAIYNQGIEDRTATFETTPRTAEAIEGLLRALGDRYPAVVVEDGPRLLGFAWTSEYRPRSAYGRVAEFAVHVASRGLCTALAFFAHSPTSQTLVWHVPRHSRRATPG